jgi:recombination protein RecA
MSSAVVSTSAALGRPFLFDDDPEAKVRPEQVRPFPSAKKPAHTQESAIASIQSTIKNQQSTISLTPASQLGIRPAPEMASSGISALDALTGGLPRGCLTEICGPASSGRTTVLLAALAVATRRGEYCALIDASDALDPHSVEAAGVDLDRLLWVRCGDDKQNSRPIKLAGQSKKPAGAPPLSRTLRQGGGFDFLSQSPLDFQQGKIESPSCEKNALEKFPRYTRPSEHCLEQVLRATDLLLESGGFGLIILDLADMPPQSARRIPLTTWFRFRRAVEHKPTILLAIEQQPIAGSCSSLLLQLSAPKFSGESIPFTQSNSSREAAARESPARKCRVSLQKEDESRRNGTDFGHGIELRGEKQTPDGTPNSARFPVHTHTQLLSGLNITAELTRSRLDRKPARSVAFATKTAWAG